MSFAALEYVLSTITVWHMAILASFLALVAWPRQNANGEMPYFLRLHAGFLAPVAFYFMMSLAAGQIFGAKLSWSDLWPSCSVASSVMATWFLVPTAAAAWSDKSLGMLGFSLFATIFATLFFGAILSAMLWLVPRAIGFGIIDFPRYAWAVQTAPLRLS